ncbi:MULTISPECIES: SDR family oxidoreductase [unclassified Streptomyces]|uniref:SDR family NAD(P)-dependent oxidoreductase n=1 Tax=unclassified Streptomyces TaxID=2593676 RepID=UPI001F0367E5|nr:MULTISPECIES: SDR family NAD(P)-dependent oxidoreductase [unclassified Streptomyces]MCH0567032.1 SDR family NAD(P)-dependent oxidoreductase [Streptomyces sp. MUM 2J]MCH0572399.1 SDR family NAD(P)-dependent oxidoreductase [Streptomyces sp. MUM 136J]
MNTVSEYGPWAVVTGASSGIGRAVAEHLAAEGVHLVLAARSTGRLEELGRRLTREHGVRHRVVTVDLSRTDGAATLLQTVGDLDVGLLVSNAGAGRPGRFLDQELDDLRARLTLNTTTHLELAHAFGHRFAARGRGAMLLVSALGALHGLPHMAHESASKAYVLHLGEALHHELAPAGVAVTVMLPGNVDTPIIDALGLDRGRLPLRPLPVETAVRQAFEALRRRRTTVIPDRRLRAATRLTPRALSIRMNGRMLEQAARNLDARRPATEPHTGDGG